MGSAAAAFFPSPKQWVEEPNFFFLALTLEGPCGCGWLGSAVRAWSFDHPQWGPDRYEGRYCNPQSFKLPPAFRNVQSHSRQASGRVERCSVCCSVPTGGCCSLYMYPGSQVLTADQPSYSSTSHSHLIRPSRHCRSSTYLRRRPDDPMWRVCALNPQAVRAQSRPVETISSIAISI